MTDNQGDTFVETNTMYGGGTWVACGAHGGPTTISFTNNYNLAAAYEIANTTTSSCVDAYNQGSSTTSAVLSTGSIVRAQPYDFLCECGRKNRVKPDFHRSKWLQRPRNLSAGGRRFEL